MSSRDEGAAQSDPPTGGDPDAAGRLAMLATTGRDRSPASLDDVLALTRDANPTVRAEALRAASRIGGADAAKAMCVLLWADADESVGRAAAAGLARLLAGTPDADRYEYAHDVILAVGLMSPERTSLVQRELDEIAGYVRRALIEQIQAADETIRTGARRLLHTLVRQLAEHDGDVSIEQAAIDAATAAVPPERSGAVARTSSGHADLVADVLAEDEDSTPSDGSSPRGDDGSLRPHAAPTDAPPVPGSDIAAALPELVQKIRDTRDTDREAALAAVRTLPRAEVGAWLADRLRRRGADVDAAAVAVAALERDDLLDAVADLLLSPDHRGVLGAAAALLRERPAMWEIVQEMQGAERPSRRLRGFDLASVLDHGRVEPVLRALDDPAAVVRAHAVRNLASKPPEPVESRLLEMIETDSSPTVRLHIVQTLARGSRELRLAVARRAISGPDPAIRTACLGLLRQRGGDEVTLLARALDDPVTSVVAESARTLARFHAPESIAILWSSLRDAHGNRRQAIMEATLELGPEIFTGPARQALDSSDANERTAGLALLTTASAPDVDLTPIIDDALVDPAPGVRREALAALRRNPDWVHVDAVGARVSDADPDVRLLALNVLDAAENDRALPYLLDAMRDPAESIRDQAKAILVSRRSPKLASTLVESLANPQTAPVAATLLLELFETSLTPLLKTIETASPATRQVIGEVLRAGGHEGNVLAALDDRHPDARRRAVEALGAMSEGQQSGTARRLVARLDDPVPSVRATAARVIGEIGDPTAIHALLEHRDTDPDPTVRRAIAHALATLGHDDLEHVLDLEDFDEQGGSRPADDGLGGDASR